LAAGLTVCIWAEYTKRGHFSRYLDERATDRIVRLLLVAFFLEGLDVGHCHRWLRVVQVAGIAAPNRSLLPALGAMLAVEIPVRLRTESLGEEIDKTAHLGRQEFSIGVDRKHSEVVDLPVGENAH